MLQDARALEFYVRVQEVQRRLIVVFHRSKKWARLSAIVASLVTLFGAGRFYSTGDPQGQQIGLLFFSLALHALITASIYLSDWFQNLDDSMRIITLTWMAPFVGTLVGYILDGWRGAAFGVGIAVAVADTIAISCSVYLYLRDEKELHAYKEGMKKYGKEP